MTTKKNSISEIKKLAEGYDELILKSLGFQNITERGVQQNCPIHKGDNPFSFSYDRAKCCWSCFTHSCQNKYGNDMIGLVRAVKEFSFEQAVNWINEVVHSDEITAGYIPRVVIDRISEPNKILSEDHVDKLTKDSSYLKSRGFEEKTLLHFQCGSTDKAIVRPQHRRIMVPIRNADGLLIGFSGRSIYDKCEETGFYLPPWMEKDSKYGHQFSKWRHYPKGLNKSLELYNFHEAKESITKFKFAIIVEGPFDLWRLWEFGIKNCVAAFGCSISRVQVETLKAIGCKCIAMMFDSDDAGNEGIKKAIISYKEVMNIEKIVLPNGKDPESISRAEYNVAVKPQLTVLRNRYEN